MGLDPKGTVSLELCQIVIVWQPEQEFSWFSPALLIIVQAVDLSVYASDDRWELTPAASR